MVAGRTAAADKPNIFVVSIDDRAWNGTSVAIEAVVRYLRAGFPDPGIGGFMSGPTRDESMRRVQQDRRTRRCSGLPIKSVLIECRGSRAADRERSQCRVRHFHVDP